MKKKYLEHIKGLNFSLCSIELYEKIIDKFTDYLKGLKNKQNISIIEITKDIINRYYEYLLNYRTRENKKLARLSINTYFGQLKNFFKFSVKQGYLIFNPMEGIKLKKLSNDLTKKIMNKNQIKRIISLIDITTATGLRDRAIIEVLYSTGIRRNEMVNLNNYDIDYENGYLRVNLGKGKKDRIIPIGKRACDWVTRYLNLSRPILIKDTSDKGLFISLQGRRISGWGLYRIIKNLMRKIKLKYSPHSFRHSFATSLLKGGADIRYVQEMLGHEDIGSTEIYTAVMVEDLRETLIRTHPRAEKCRNKKKKKKK